MKASNIAVVAVLLYVPLLFARPSQHNSLTPSEEIHNVLSQQAAAWNRFDIEGYMEGYWHSDSLLFTSSGGIRRGWKETLEKYKKSYDSKSKMGELEFSGIEISLLSSESAWVFGRWKLRRANDAPGGVFTLVMKKFWNGWKIIHDHTSTDPLPTTIKKLK